MKVPLLLALIVAVLNFTLAMLIVAKGVKKSQNIIFLLLVLSVSFWAIVSGISNQTTDSDYSRVFSQLGYGAAIAIVGFSYLLSVSLGVRNNKTKNTITNTSVPIIILGVIFGSTKYVYDATTLEEFSYGPLVGPYFLFIIIGLGLILYELHTTFKKGNAVQKQQVRLVVGGLTISMLLIMTLNLIIPYFTDSEVTTLYSPIFSFIFIYLAALAITKHKLFDIKAVVARSLFYIFTTLFVVGGYVIVAFFVKRFFLPESKVETGQLIANIILTIFLVLSFPYIKGWFDKVSNKYFFRDAYDPQELIDRLNQTLVTNVNLDELLTKSALIMQEEIKASFCTFYIRETSYFDNRIIGAHRKFPEFDDIDDIEKHASKIHTKVFSSESSSDNDNENKLAKALKSNDVEVMARLTNTLDFEVKGIGYIFMGPKKSGSQYTSQDMKILEIIANELVIAIENVLRFEEIEQFNVTLQKKIDDATKELKQTNEKLRALDEAKDEFVSMASHQLRTPLTSIKGYISMVLEGDAGKITETQKTMLGQAFFSSQRMVYLISDLLNVSRLKTGKFVIESKPVYLPDVVESEINQLQDGATAKNLTLSFTKPKEFATMNLDEMKLRQVIMNFTDNAIYYTPAGGKISIELKETPKTVEFTIKDSGIGVPKDQQHKLFTKFYRADNARKARPDGTGLGLFMAKKVIIAQGGSMIFESKENKGSTFGFSFPKEKLLVEETPKSETK